MYHSQAFSQLQRLVVIFVLLVVWKNRNGLFGQIISGTGRFAPVGDIAVSLCEPVGIVVAVVPSDKEFADVAVCHQCRCADDGPVDGTGVTEVHIGVIVTADPVVKVYLPGRTEKFIGFEYSVAALRIVEENPPVTVGDFAVFVRSVVRAGLISGGGVVIQTILICRTEKSFILEV